MALGKDVPEGYVKPKRTKRTRDEPKQEQMPEINFNPNQ